MSTAIPAYASQSHGKMSHTHGIPVEILSVRPNRKSHMGFRLVSKSVTLNDLARGVYSDRLAFFRRIRYLGADYVKVVEDRPIQSAT